MRRLKVALTVLTAVVLLAGCADPGGNPDAGASDESPTEPSVLPTLPRPSAPPSTPSDPHPRDILAGRITGGSGSCYTLTDDDGRTFALVGIDRALTTGQVVRVQLKPDATPVPADCEGTPVTVVKVEILG